MNRFLSKKLFIILPIVLALICACVIYACRGTIKVSFDIYDQSQDPADYTVYSENGRLNIDDLYIKDKVMHVTASYVSPGDDFITTVSSDGVTHLNRVIVHKSGIITETYYLGNCRGSWIIPVCVFIYLVLAFISLVWKYRHDTAEDLYQYKNITTFGLIVFIGFLIILQVFRIFAYSGLYSYMFSMLGSAGGLSIFSFPFAFILALLIIASNINLMRKEGRNLRNMLGIILSVVFCFMLIFPSLFSDFIFNHTNAEVHRETGIGRHMVMFVEDGIASVVSYIECILIGTIVVALRAAKHVPPFDRDYIMILGCMINKDGTLTKLLQGRADRALEFARMQKEASGKDIVFVPSGGQGSDEVISEAEAIKNYLVSAGVPENKILVENKSANTYENLKFSNDLIRSIDTETEPKLAFSTTNYHVFRSGMYASKQGIKAEGIGSKTKRYFWVNAFIREFVATLSSERKRHVRICLGLLLIVLVMVLVMYFSVQV